MELCSYLYIPKLVEGMHRQLEQVREH
jgi:hypothetical protein